MDLIAVRAGCTFTGSKKTKMVQILRHTKGLYGISSWLNIKKRQRNTDPIFDNMCKCCLFAGLSDSEFNGNSGVVAATQGYDRWVVFQR